MNEQRGRLRALVCHEAVARRAIRTLLDAVRVDVVAESDYCFEALGDISELQPDIVVLDLASSGALGVEAISTILTISPHTRVIVFSPFDGLRADALAAGAHAVIDREDMRGFDEAARRLVGVSA